MINPGLYLWLARTARKLGGPALFMLFAGALSMGLEKAVRVIAEAAGRAGNILEAPVFTVFRDAVSEDGTGFSAGNRFRVLVRDGEYVMVEKVQEEEPHVVPVSFVADISDYSIT